MFSATIKTSVKVSVLSDGAESLRKLVGLIPKDDPVYFDPRAVQKVAHGAAVLYGSRDVVGETSPVDRGNLIKEDLAKLLAVEGETNQSSVQPAVVEQPEPKPSELEGAQEYGVNAGVSLEL